MDVQNTMWLINEEKQVTSEEDHIFESDCIDETSYSVYSNHIYNVDEEIAPYCTKPTKKIIRRHLRCNINHKIL